MSRRFKRSQRAFILILMIILSYYVLCFYLFFTTTPVNQSDDEWSEWSYKGQIQCKCDHERFFNENQTNLAGSCDKYSASRGRNQNIVNFSFYGKLASAYFNGIEENAKLIQLFYPNWVMRVYHNIDLNALNTRTKFCKLWCKYDHLDFCDIHYLPAPLYDSSNVHPMLWRAFTLGDPLVDRFISRDLDSLISEREVAAVSEWIDSGKTWHFMRDHPKHGYPIMGGMWGGMNKDLQLTTSTLKLIIADNLNNSKGTDQDVLSRVLLPIAEESDDYMNHNSYSCTEGRPKKFQPWPVKRGQNVENNDFVGNPILRYNFPLKKDCPEECRPPNHKDWLRC